ncbi:DUF268 domain-containing protein [Dehalococcoidia bacterium]|nr:DUF268 domain-containing protein [Dehalococcoidia bacterium]
MSIFEDLRKPFYKWLRENRPLNQALYYFAGISFWLLSARRFYCGTRVVEIPWVLAELRKNTAITRILQIGDIILKKALEKYEVILVDLDAAENPQDSLKIYKTDIREASLPSSYFDIAISISTLEHIGLSEPRFADGDKVLVDIIKETLKPGGLFLFSVPFGKLLVRENFRVYGQARLKFILEKKFELLEEKYLVWKKLKWWERSAEEAEKAAS